MATLYNTLRSRENGCLLFLLIVFILGFGCAWKTGAHLWITWIDDGMGLGWEELGDGGMCGAFFESGQKVRDG
jgi:hypothetical protein